MVLEIPLTKGYVAVVDDCDADLAELKWITLKSQQSNTAYSVGYYRGVQQLMHRVIVARMVGRELTKSEHVDHINGMGIDNRRTNLRIATRRQNLGNCRKQSSSTNPYKGVCRATSRKYPWSAKIQKGDKQFYLGKFKTVELAHLAYCLAAYAQWGVYANFGDNSPFKTCLLEKQQAFQEAA